MIIPKPHPGVCTVNTFTLIPLPIYHTVDVMFEPVPVAGGRSRLHLLDLGSCSKSKDGQALSLQALGNVIWALLNGQRHVPYR